MLSRSILNYLAINMYTSTGHNKGVKFTDIIICLCDSIILLLLSFKSVRPRLYLPTPVCDFLIISRLIDIPCKNDTVQLSKQRRFNQRA